MVFVSPGSVSRTLVAIATLLTATPFSAAAAPRKPDPNLPSQIKAAVEPLLFAARTTVSSASVRVNAVQSKTREFGAIGQALDKKARDARQAYDTAADAHGSALDGLYSAKVAGITVSAMLNLNTTLRDQVRNFRDQAINSSSTSFISGDQFRSRRSAMSQIVRSEKDYIAQVTALLRGTSTWLERFRAELDTVSRQTDNRSLGFGFDHYLSLADQRLEARRTQLSKASSFFNGKGPAGNTEQPAFECSDRSSAPFRSFSGDLDIVEGWAAAPRVYSSTDPAVNSWTKVMTLAALAAYDGNSQTGVPGYIQAWASCINSKSSSIRILGNDIARALQRGELDLAKTLDLQRAQLDFEKTVLEGQRDVVSHRREQLARIMSSAAAQGTPENLTAYPDAWRKTIAAHVKDLKDVSAAFPELFATSLTLLNEVETELDSLDGLVDWQEIQTRLKFVVRNIDIIRKDGFERLLSQLESVQESLDAMATGIADGDNILSEALSVYETSTATKVAFLTSERSLIPAKIAAAQSRTQTTANALSNARESVNTSGGKAKLFQDKLKEFNESSRLYNSTVGASRLNPIYTDLIDELMRRASAKRAVTKQQVQLKRQLQQTLAGFNGTAVVPAPSKKCRPFQKNCTPINTTKLKNPAAKALRATQRSMLKEVPNLIAVFSRKAAGVSLTDLVAKIESAHRTIMSLK